MAVFQQVKQDGECGFLALLTTLDVDPADYSTADLRRQLAMFLISNKEEMLDKVQMALKLEEYSFRRYVWNIIHGSWAFFTTMGCVTRMWDVGIALHFPNSKCRTINCPKNHANKADLHVIFNMANHYSGTGETCKITF